MKPQSFSFTKRLRSFIHAWRGFETLLKSEHNARIHLLATVLVISAGFYFRINLTEWSLIALSIGLVFMAELFNTAIEYLCNHVTPGHHEQIGKIKDLAAAAVLAIVISAIAAGLIIFLPKLTTP